MSEDSAPEIYEIDIEFTDSGLQMVLDMEEWLAKAENDFGTFEDIIEFYRKPPKEMVEDFEEGLEEVEPDEPRETPGIVINNPPKDWKEEPRELAQILDFVHQQLVGFGLRSLIEQELEEEQVLIDQEQFKPLVIRQSAFFEDLLTFRSLLAWQEQKESTLSTSELSIIENMGHSDRLRVAHLFDIIDEDEHGILQEMARWRNQISHTAWPEFDSQQEAQIQSVGERIHDMLEEEIQAEEDELDETHSIDEDFDIGFGGLDIETQNLQLSILDVIQSQGGPVEIDYIQEVLPQPDDQLAQRCLRLSEVGYVERQDRTLRLKEKGEDLLNEEWIQE